MWFNNLDLIDNLENPSMNEERLYPANACNIVSIKGIGK